MIAVTRGIDVLLGLVAALAWGFAVFALGARLVSPAAGGIAGLGVLLSAVTMVLAMYLGDARLAALAKGACPRCRAAVVSDHRHRHWDPGAGEWLPPSTTWDCPRCAFAHSEAWPCSGCSAEA
jgi:hypothetical protein